MKLKELCFCQRYLTQLFTQASLCVLLKEKLAARSLAASVEHLAISRLC